MWWRVVERTAVAMGTADVRREFQAPAAQPKTFIVGCVMLLLGWCARSSRR